MQISVFQYLLEACIYYRPSTFSTYTTQGNESRDRSLISPASNSLLPSLRTDWARHSVCIRKRLRPTPPDLLHFYYERDVYLFAALYRSSGWSGLYMNESILAKTSRFTEFSFKVQTVGFDIKNSYYCL